MAPGSPPRRAGSSAAPPPVPGASEAGRLAAETAKLLWAEECGSASNWVAALALPRSGGDAQAVREPQEGRRGGARLRVVSGIAS